MHRKCTMRTQLILNVDFGFWFVELLEFFGAFSLFLNFQLKMDLAVHKLNYHNATGKTFN